MKKILIVEDEPNLARFLELELRHESYEAAVAVAGHTGLAMALEQDWDMILLDIMLPGMSGMEVCREIRAAKDTPIIMITARNKVNDRVRGLDCGGDDYLSKPFAIEELLARMRALFRRLELSENASETLSFSDLTLDMRSRIVTQGEDTIVLTKREFDLLECFMQNVNIVLTRDIILDKVWGYDSEVETNVVDVYVRYLRGKLNDLKEEKYIKTLRGVGYVMRL
ncbi:response regulator transcription factor [Paenibacillus sp. HB172176]|uniref:response regulator transcription factor n=1 Tax=Paenibacillus sp. HB172176 TaxID=2493690 RepID=UPI00143AE0A6|nr:response regulator transcription factor [Paenibacillus sp. HB172176]